MGVKVKIATNGFAYGPAEFGGVQFMDGVSVDELSPSELRLIGGSVSLVDAETGEGVGPGADLVKQRGERVKVQKSLKEAEADHNAEVEQDKRVKAKVKEMLKSDLSSAQLQEIADKRGINGLRVIAAELDVKGKDIKVLIEKIIAAQAKRLIKTEKDVTKDAEKAVKAEIKKEAKLKASKGEKKEEGE